MHIVTTLTPTEVCAVQHALADYAADFYTGGAMGFVDTANGVIAEHLTAIADVRGMSAVYAATTHFLREHPEWLTMPRDQRERLRDLRISRARRTLAAAEQTYFAGDYVVAGELVDRAARTDSGIDVTELRERINAAVARCGQPEQGPLPRPGDDVLDVWKLLAKIARLHPAESSRTALRTLERVQARNCVVFDDAEQTAMSGLADFFATAAVTTATTAGLVDVSSLVSPAAALLRAHGDAAEALRQIGVPRGHITDGSLYTTVTAAETAMTWAIVTHGWLEAHRRLSALTPLALAQV